MLVPELQRRQNNSIAKRKQIVFLQSQYGSGQALVSKQLTRPYTSCGDM